METRPLRCRGPRAAWLPLLFGLCTPAPSSFAFDLLEGRLSLQGYAELQLRTLARDFEASDDFDLAQWYQVLNLELDADLAPRGFGIFHRISAYARIEVRYDCVWTRGCGLLRSADTYGDRAHRLPGRLSDARERGFVASIEDGDRRRLLGQERDEIAFGFKDRRVSGHRRPGPLFNVDGLMDLFAIEGPDGSLESFDDPAPYVFRRFEEDRFAARRTSGPTDGVDLQMLGPWLPKNRIRAVRPLADRWNPLRGAVDAVGSPRRDGGDTHPVITYPDVFPGNPEFTDPQGNVLDGLFLIPSRGVLDPASGSFPIADVEKPFRPAPDCRFDDRSCPRTEARGLFIPNPALVRALRKGDLDGFDQNFRQAELAWNRGASQQDEKELRELYLDLELQQGRLWLRLGKQNIVWGKTELFRTTDQFNPQDLALATLPHLEESRIPLWALRGVYSFYTLGPLEDLRLEVALGLDSFEPADIGRCGEPFASNPVCFKSFGLFSHGITASGLAGERRPEAPWNSARGLEGGARIEFLWRRFSVQISDFYGFEDFPVPRRLFRYERNVDPLSGMPRRAGARGPCTAADGDGDGLPDREDPDCLGPAGDALRNHPANQQLFAVICAATLGASLLEPSTCGLTGFNSRQFARINVGTEQSPVYAQLTPNTNAFGLFLEGGPLGKITLGNFLQLSSASMVAAGYLDLNGDGLVTVTDLPLVRLVADAGDDRPDIPGSDPSLDGALSAEQEALLGCGPFYEVGFNAASGLQGCHLNGLDLLNAEASALVQAWPGFEGTFGRGFDFLAAGLAGTPVPGTQGFVGGPVCTRFVAGGLVVLPGCRGPGEAGYDVLRDGTPPNAPSTLAVDIRRHPFACTDPGSPTLPRDPATCQAWRSEMAALSWNLLVSLVMLSGAGEPAAEVAGRVDFFDPTQPFASGKCSFQEMHLCFNVQAIWSLVGRRRATLRAGGAEGFGRRDFAWHQGGSDVLHYEKRNVLGFAVDFAEDLTRSNWGIEFAWTEGLPFVDQDARDGVSRASTFSLAVSVDRPTFVNFLNPGRSFFVNSQWFVQYIRGHRPGFTVNGPVNVLGTLTVLTGYYQDRLQPALTFVYDVRSGSGAVLFQLGYRLTERLSATFGVNAFAGRFQAKRAPLEGVNPSVNRVGRRADRQLVENGLAAVRDRDEAFLTVRYTF